MKLRLTAIAVCFLLVASLTLALEGPKREKIINEGGSAQDEDPILLTCQTVYQSTCGMNRYCVTSQAENACCGDCHKPDGTHAPCNACHAN